MVCDYCYFHSCGCINKEYCHQSPTKECAYCKDRVCDDCMCDCERQDYGFLREPLQQYCICTKKEKQEEQEKHEPITRFFPFSDAEESDDEVE